MPGRDALSTSRLVKMVGWPPFLTSRQAMVIFGRHSNP